MDGLGLPAGDLGHPLGRAAGGGAQRHLAAGLLQQVDDGVDGGGFAGAGAAGEDEDFVLQRLQDGLLLQAGVADLAGLLQLGQQLLGGGFYLQRLVRAQHEENPLGDVALVLPVFGQVAVGAAVDLHLHQLAAAQQRLQLLFHHDFALAQQLLGGGQQLVQRQAGVAV